ncbi:hypothetical protein ATCC90586_004062 [Pythium insidiosum]|nr:hypothetical protein ATCC90586_004062 [Pythium insidiosum]
MGSYLSIQNDTPYVWECKIGPDYAALNIAAIVIAAVGVAAAIIGTAGAAAPAVAVAAGGGLLVTGVSASAVASFAASEVVDGFQTDVHVLYMRPIFSGPTVSSDYTYQIQHWVDKKGTERWPVAAITDTF